MADGAATEITFADASQTGEIPSPERFGAIERTFEFIQDAIDENAATITVQYHRELGHPTSAFINYDLMMMDEEMRFTVTSLRRVS